MLRLQGTRNKGGVFSGVSINSMAVCGWEPASSGGGGGDPPSAKKNVHSGEGNKFFKWFEKQKSLIIQNADLKKKKKG